MGEKKEDRRICVGVYRDNDKNEVQVLLVTRDIDTGEETLVCKRRYHDKENDYFTIKKSSFCEMIDTPKGPKPKYTRNTHHAESDDELWYFHDLGFDEIPRLKRRNRTAKHDEYPVLRDLHRSKNYDDYARELCGFYITDLRRIRLCREYKTLYGISAKEYKTVREDLKFTDTCFKTVLKQYAKLFYGRFGSKQLSIRKYAEENNVSRGSVEYEQKKMIAEFARELMLRDQKDGIQRIVILKDDDEDENESSEMSVESLIKSMTEN